MYKGNSQIQTIMLLPIMKTVGGGTEKKTNYRKKWLCLGCWGVGFCNGVGVFVYWTNGGE